MVTAVPCTSTTVASSSLEFRLCRFAFPSAVLLETGKTCLVATVNASDAATAPNRVAVIAICGSLGWDLNAHGETRCGTPQLDCIGLGVGQAPVAFGTLVRPAIFGDGR